MEKLSFRQLSREQLKTVYGGQSSFDQCGGDITCPGNLCCSGYGWCGDTVPYCGYGTDTCTPGCQSGPCIHC